MVSCNILLYSNEGGKPSYMLKFPRADQSSWNIVIYNTDVVKPSCVLKPPGPDRSHVPLPSSIVTKQNLQALLPLSESLRVPSLVDIRFSPLFHIQCIFQILLREHELEFEKHV